MKKINEEIKFLKKSDSKEFKKFLLNLSKKTQKTFNHFGVINSKTVQKIIKNELSNLDKIKFFTFVNDEMIAYSFLSKFKKLEKKHNCILGIVISDKWQSKGFGKIIIKKMISDAWNLNFKKIWLNVHYDNKQAFELYKAVGFEVEGIFMDDEILKSEMRHMISMAIFKEKKLHKQKRLSLLKKLESNVGIKNVKIEQLSASHKHMFLNFVQSLDSVSLSTYTRWKTSIDPHKIVKEIIENITFGKELAWVAIENNEIVGYEHVNFREDLRNDVLTEGSLVLDKCSGRGIGSELKKKCNEDCFKRQFFKLVALIHEGNLISMYNALNNGFLIAGIFFNAAKKEGRSLYMIYFERPLKLQSTQSTYLNKLQKFSVLKPIVRKSQNKKSFEIEIISNYDSQKNLIPNTIVSHNISPIIVAKKNGKIINYCYLEYFDYFERKHVAKLHIQQNVKNISSYDLVISTLLKYHVKNNIEKIWINVHEIKSTLIQILTNLGFIVEGIAMGHTIIDSKEVNDVLLALHLKIDVSTINVIELINKLSSK